MCERGNAKHGHLSREPGATAVTNQIKFEVQNHKKEIDAYQSKKLHKHGTCHLTPIGSKFLTITVGSQKGPH